MNPPPPILPALGSTAASAKAVATAASTALPPSRSTATPTSVASAWSATTMPCAPSAAGVSSGKGQPSGTRGRPAALAGAAVGAGVVVTLDLQPPTARRATVRRADR